MTEHNTNVSGGAISEWQILMTLTSSYLKKHVMEMGD